MQCGACGRHICTERCQAALVAWYAVNEVRGQHMIVVLRILSMVLRICFFALSTRGLVMLILDARDQQSVHASVMASILCLYGSCVLSSPSVMRAVLLALSFATLMGCDIFYIRHAKRGGDLFLPAALLCALGVAVGFDAMGSRITSHVIRISLFCLASMAVFALVRRSSHRLAVSYVPLLAATAVLCALPLVPGLGIRVNGATAWIGVAGHRLGQPAELAKVTLAAGLAGYLAANADRLSTFNSRGILPLGFVFVLAAATEWLVKDIGTAMVLLAAVAAMVMISSRRAGVVYALIAVVGVTGMLVFAYHNFAYVAQRFDAWLKPQDNYSGGHLMAAATTMANGGIIGTGLGLGHCYGSVFAIETDAIYTIIVEELGIIGGLQALLAIVALAFTASRVVRDLPKESFERNLVNVVSVIICVQAFIIIAGITRVIPLTGVTLPFVSYGGSSLLSCFLLMGLMIAAGSTDKYTSEGRGFSAAVVPVLCAVGCAACLAMTGFVVCSKGVRLCGLTNHYTLGEVVSSDGVVLARGSKEGTTISYSFPEGRLASHVLGFASDGVTARIRTSEYLEQTTNPVLNTLGLPEVLAQTTLTLDTRVQRVAEEQLEGQVGAIVAYNVKTGAIAAEASSPTFDPNIGMDPNDPTISVFNRVIKSSYAPGSTFKIVTSAAALEGGFATPETQLEGNTLTLPEGQQVNNLGAADFGPITLTTALQYSSNTAFADLALRMGNDPLQAQAEAMGFNHDPGDTLTHTRMSTYGPALTDHALAWAAVGQPTIANGQACGPQVTVLQMAEVMAAVSNKGAIQAPYLMEKGIWGKGIFGQSRRAMSASTAEQLWNMLVESSHVVGSNVPVAGKTGTAETGSTNVCWYVCAAGDYVVACCIEGTFDLGSTVALPRGLAVLDSLVELGAYELVYY